jgi:phosphonopyruvate decarboxylase
MLDPNLISREIHRLGVQFVVGVPDSILASLCHSLDEQSGLSHRIAVNEGAAVALAVGWYLGTSTLPCVYMQNSGLGNAVNPLASVAHKSVFGVPLLLLIGMRGSPGDEPQHSAMGKCTRSLLSLLGIPTAVMPASEDQASEALAAAVDRANSHPSIQALIVNPGTFAPLVTEPQLGISQWSRSEAMSYVCSLMGSGDVTFSTAGFISREVAQIRAMTRTSLDRDILVTGGMGHCSHIALGFALSHPERRVWCLDGDGALLMHMGALAAIGVSGCRNFVHVLFNNGSYESVGGQPSIAKHVDLSRVCRALGYCSCIRLTAPNSSGESHLDEGPVFMELDILNAKAAAPRPSVTPAANLELFMKHYQSLCS